MNRLILSYNLLSARGKLYDKTLKMDADRQIRQMVNFILQEAKEKASEIYVKAEHDFSLEKQ